MPQIIPFRARPAPINTLVSQQLGLYNQAHQGRQIDPRAALAVAAQEGLSGRIGDGGHAFGPFQENNAGGVLTGRFNGQTPEQLQAWATSPAGIQDALGRIGGVAGGLKGSQAVQAIVSKFERPANIQGEITRALAAYGSQPGAAPGPLATAALGGNARVSSAPAAPPPNFRPQLAAQLASARGTATNDLSGFYATLQKALQARQAAPTPTLKTSGLVASPGEQAPTQPLPVGSTGIAKTALTQLGTPYQWGGKAALGSRTDCSGLLQASARANGIALGRTTYDQFKQGTPVALNQLQPGDAVFSEPTQQGPGHVAIYIGNGKVVEDPHTGAVVSIGTIAGRRGIVGARRYG